MLGRSKYITSTMMLAAIAALIGTGSLSAARSEQPSGKYYIVKKAVDGDTLKLSDGRKVRLIGIDTPEVHYSNKLLKDAKKSNKDVKDIQDMGKKAWAFTKKLVEGKKVRLEYDVDRKDRYGRTLAYVYLEDNTFVNARIVEEGYAQVMTYPPNVKYADLFVDLQRKARESGKGLWAAQ